MPKQTVQLVEFNGCGGGFRFFTGSPHGTFLFDVEDNKTSCIRYRYI